MTSDQEIHLSRLTYALVARLTELRDKFRIKGQLAKDDSFFQTNDQLAKWLHCKERSLMRVRKRAIEARKIDYVTFAVKGKASLYWILDRTQAPHIEIHQTWITQAPLNPEEIRQNASLFGKDFVLKRYTEAGYSEAEIITILGKPK